MCFKICYSNCKRNRGMIMQWNMSIKPIKKLFQDRRILEILCVKHADKYSTDIYLKMFAFKPVLRVSLFCYMKNIQCEYIMILKHSLPCKIPIYFILFLTEPSTSYFIFLTKFLKLIVVPYQIPINSSNIKIPSYWKTSRNNTIIIIAR